MFILSSTRAQDYSDYGNEYAQDSIYYDYANKQVEKQAGRGAGWVQNSILLFPALYTAAELPFIDFGYLKFL